MAGAKPTFLTGANAKIQVNGRTLAYATNLSYSVKVQHAEPTVLGMYEPTSVEPLSYKVSGSFSVVRYVADIITDVGGTQIAGGAQEGNGIGNWGDGDPISTDGRTNENLNPRELNKATGFDIEIVQKFAGGTRSVAKVRGARITQADFALSKKAPATQTFTFSALYLDEDSFLADFSGSGQQFD